MQRFRKIARGSKYKERLLIEEFKKEMNSIIRRKLIKAKYLSKNIEQ